jgi:hypothetical protein
MVMDVLVFNADGTVVSGNAMYGERVAANIARQIDAAVRNP